ncbi:carbon-nitrogen hydrolase family protein [Marinomonas epiphytica]
MSKLIVAGLQLTSGQCWRKNFAQVESLLQAAVNDGARLLVLPENVFLFSGKDMRALAESQEQLRLMEQVASLAKQYNVYIVVGSHPYAYDEMGEPLADHRVRQRSWVFAPDGTLQCHYDKVHLFDVDVEDSTANYRESNFIEPADWHPTLIDIDGVKVGLSICYDLRFPELYRDLSQAGAQLILVPAAFTYVTGKAHWLTLLAARAIENQCYFLGVNQCGWHNEKRQTYGHSVLFSPYGEKLAGLGERVGYFVAKIDTNEVVRVRDKMPCQLHRRIGV